MERHLPDRAVLKGHDFSRAICQSKSVRPSGPEGRSPNGLRSIFPVLAATLAIAIAAQAQTPATAPTPIAIVPTSSAATVTGALQVTDGKTLIANSGAITSGDKTTEVVLPRRGILRVCASTTVKLTADTTEPAGNAPAIQPGDDSPGLMMALDHGALETDFAIGRNSDILLTPDFRILLGGPGASHVNIRLGPHGDTCVDNALPGGASSTPAANAPYVLVTGIFDGGVYRVQPGQRVMFQHGSLRDVVDQEKEPCGCPAPPRPNSNDFPLAQSAGLAPIANPATAPKPQPTVKKLPPEVSTPMVYQAAPLPLGPEQKPQPDSASATTQAGGSQPAARTAALQKKHRSFLKKIGGFFRKIFGAD